jgi:predicted dehydrogenase
MDKLRVGFIGAGRIADLRMQATLSPPPNRVKG